MEGLHDHADDMETHENLASFGKVVKQAGKSGQHVNLQGHSVTPNPGEAMSTHQLCEKVMKFTSSHYEDSQPGQLATRCDALEDMQTGLKAMSAKADSSFKAKIYGRVGKQTSTQKELKKAINHVKGALQDVGAKIKLEVKADNLEGAPNDALSILMQRSLTDPKVVRKLMFHRCMDHTQSPEVRANQQELDGYNFAAMQKGMKEDIQGVLKDPNFASHYSPADIEKLNNICEQLDWAAETVSLIDSYTPPITEEEKNALEEAKTNLEESTSNLELTQTALNELKAITSDPNNDVRTIVDHICNHETSKANLINNLYSLRVEQRDDKKSHAQQEKNPLLQERLSAEVEVLNKTIIDLDDQITNAVSSPKPYDSLTHLFTDEELSKTIESTQNSLKRSVNMWKWTVANDQKPFEALDVAKLALEKTTDRIVDHIKEHANDELGVMFSGGLRNHAMMYKVNKAANGTYTFSILNTGEGLNHHHRKGPRFQTHAHWSGLTMEQIADPTFIRELMRIRQQEPGKLG